MSATSRRTREEAGRCMRAGPLFGREREGDGPAVPGGAIDRREQLHRAPAVGGGHGGRAAREHRLEKVSNLQAVEVLHGIGAAEESGVLLLPLREQALLPGDCPNVVEGGVGDPGAASDKHGASVGLHRSEEHTSELQSPCNLVCRLLLEKKKKKA